MVFNNFVYNIQWWCNCDSIYMKSTHRSKNSVGAAWDVCFTHYSFVLYTCMQLLFQVWSFKVKKRQYTKQECMSCTCFQILLRTPNMYSMDYSDIMQSWSKWPDPITLKCSLELIFCMDCGFELLHCPRGVYIEFYACRGLFMVHSQIVYFSLLST